MTSTLNKLLREINKNNLCFNFHDCVPVTILRREGREFRHNVHGRQRAKPVPDNGVVLTRLDEGKFNIIGLSLEEFDTLLAETAWSLIPFKEKEEEHTENQEGELTFIQFTGKLIDWYDNFKLIEFKKNNEFDVFEIQLCGRGRAVLSEIYKRQLGSWIVSPYTETWETRTLYNRYKKEEFKFLDDTFETYKEKMEQEK